jgi:hypothetical protein
MAGASHSWSCCEFCCLKWDGLRPILHYDANQYQGNRANAVYVDPTILRYIPRLFNNKSMQCMR